MIVINTPGASSLARGRGGRGGRREAGGCGRWVRGVARKVVRDLHLPNDAAVNPGDGGEVEREK